MGARAVGEASRATAAAMQRPSSRSRGRVDRLHRAPSPVSHHREQDCSDLLRHQRLPDRMSCSRCRTVGGRTARREPLMALPVATEGGLSSSSSSMVHRRQRACSVCRLRPTRDQVVVGRRNRSRSHHPAWLAALSSPQSGTNSCSTSGRQGRTSQRWRPSRLATAAAVVALAATAVVVGDRAGGSRHPPSSSSSRSRPQHLRRDMVVVVVVAAAPAATAVEAAAAADPRAASSGRVGRPGSSLRAVRRRRSCPGNRRRLLPYRRRALLCRRLSLPPRRQS